MKGHNPEDTIHFIRETMKNITQDPHEIYYVLKKSEVIESKDETIDGYETATTEGIAIRILRDGRMGFGYSTRLDTEGIEKTVQQTIDSLKVSEKDPAHGLLDAAVPYPALELTDPALASLTADQKKEMVITIEHTARAFDPRVKQVRNAQLSLHEARVWLINSFGLERTYSATGVSASIMLTAEEGDSSEYGWESVSGHFLKDIIPEAIGEKAAEKAVTRLGGKPVRSGEYPALFDREVVAEIIGLLAPSFTGENLYKGKSALKGKEGTEAFSPHLTLHDGLLYTEGMAAAPFDGEGEPARKTVLIDQGIVAGFLYDHYYAKKMGALSTANAVRGGISAPPSCGTTNLYLAPGETLFSNILRDISEGFYVQELMGLHTANPITGEFSLGASGQWIENGELTHPVRGVAVSGNLFDLLKHVEVVGNDLKWFGTIGTPSLLVGSLTVAGTENS
ncbi:MAG: TldD/PmbA family protein [Deltaproteobacteria bacterium]|nr:TldD/PmbA family protein [Deltaproteobacteria bacterium]